MKNSFSKNIVLKKHVFAVVTCLAAFASAGTSLGASSDPPARIHVVLQIEQEPDYNASDIVRLLSMQSYVGAISQRLVSGPESPSPERVALLAEFASQEIVTLTFSGASGADVSEAKRLVIDHLSSLVPTRRRTMHASLARAEHELAEAQKEVERTEAAVAAFRDQHGGGVVDMLGEIQAALRNQRGELTSLDDRLAVATATRDYLREALKAPSHSESPNGLRFELNELEKDYRALLERVKAEHPDAVKARERIVELSDKVDALKASPIPVHQLEARLFSVEEEVFGYERRREWLTQQIAENNQAERTIARTRDAWVSLDAKSRQAQMRVDDARNVLLMLKRDYTRMPQDEWIRVIADG